MMMERGSFFPYDFNDTKLENPLELKLHLRKCLAPDDHTCDDDDVIHQYLVTSDQEGWSSCHLSCKFCHKTFLVDDLPAHQEECPLKLLNCKICEKIVHLKDYQTHMQKCIQSKESVLHSLEMGCNKFYGEPIENEKTKCIEEAFEALYQEIMNITKDIAKLREDNIKLKENIDMLKKENSESKDLFPQIFKRLEELAKINTGISMEAEDIRNMFEELQSENGGIVKLISEMRTQFDNLKKDNQKVNSDNATLKHLVEQALEEGTKNREEFKKLAGIYESFSKHLSDLQDNVHKLKASQLKVERDAVSANENTIKLNESIELIKSDNLAFKCDIRSVKESLETAKKTMKEQETSYIKHVDGIGTDILQLKEENEHFQNSIVIFQKLLSKADEHYGTLIENINSTLNEVPIVRKENEELKSKIEETNKINRSVEQDRYKLKMNLLSLKKETKEIRIFFKDLISHEKASLYTYLKKQNNFNNEMRNRIEQIEERFGIRNRKQITEAQVDTTAGHIISVENKTLEELKSNISRQLFGSREDDRHISHIFSNVDVDERIDKDLGLQSINGTVYRCKLKQGVRDPNKEDLVLLYLYQVAASHPWPPTGSDRALWCIVEPLRRMQVLCYQVSEAKLGSESHNRVKYKYFMWRALEKELIQKLKSKIGFKKLQSSFIIYKNIV